MDGEDRAHTTHHTHRHIQLTIVSMFQQQTRFLSIIFHFHPILFTPCFSFSSLSSSQSNSHPCDIYTQMYGGPPSPPLRNFRSLHLSFFSLYSSRRFWPILLPRNWLSLLAPLNLPGSHNHHHHHRHHHHSIFIISPPILAGLSTFGGIVPFIFHARTLGHKKGFVIWLVRANGRSRLTLFPRYNTNPHLIWQKLAVLFLTMWKQGQDGQLHGITEDTICTGTRDDLNWRSGWYLLQWCSWSSPAWMKLGDSDSREYGTTFFGNTGLRRSFLTMFWDVNSSSPIQFSRDRRWSSQDMIYPVDNDCCWTNFSLQVPGLKLSKS